MTREALRLQQELRGEPATRRHRAERQRLIRASCKRRPWRALDTDRGAGRGVEAVDGAAGRDGAACGVGREGQRGDADDEHGDDAEPATYTSARGATLRPAAPRSHTTTNASSHSKRQGDSYLDAGSRGERVRPLRHGRLHRGIDEPLGGQPFSSNARVRSNQPPCRAVLRQVEHAWRARCRAVVHRCQHSGGTALRTPSRARITARSTTSAARGWAAHAFGLGQLPRCCAAVEHVLLLAHQKAPCTCPLLGRRN